jgi:hypothetical protein
VRKSCNLSTQAGRATAASKLDYSNDPLDMTQNEISIRTGHILHTSFVTHEQKHHRFNIQKNNQLTVKHCSVM